MAYIHKQEVAHILEAGSCEGGRRPFGRMKLDYILPNTDVREVL